MEIKEKKCKKMKLSKTKIREYTFIVMTYVFIVAATLLFASDLEILGKWSDFLCQLCIGAATGCFVVALQETVNNEELTKIIKELKTKIYNDEYEKTESMSVLFESENKRKKFVRDITKLFMQREGPERSYQHEKSYNGVDISEYLGKIKYAEKECILILAISNNEVVDYILVCGQKDSSILASYYFEQKDNQGRTAIDFVANWYNKGAQICNYHNHPLRFAAIPSDDDIKNINDRNSIAWRECIEIYGKDYPQGFTFDDWGVVTSFDFFSYSKFIKEGQNQEELLRYSKETSDLINKLSKKYGVSEDDLDPPSPVDI